MGELNHQRRSYLYNELPHQNVLGIIEDVLSIAEDVFGISADVLNIIMDVPRPLIHSLLYRNLI